MRPKASAAPQLRARQCRDSSRGRDGPSEASAHPAAPSLPAPSNGEGATPATAMSIPLVILFYMLPLFHVAKGDIPPIACIGHGDCTCQRLFSPFSKFDSSQAQALCEGGVCASMKPNATCKNLNDCGAHRSCRSGRCVLGGLGADCSAESINCMPGFTCDSASGKCVRSVEEVIFRYEYNCGFGHVCAFDKTFRGKCKDKFFLQERASAGSRLVGGCANLAWKEHASVDETCIVQARYAASFDEIASTPRNGAVIDSTTCRDRRRLRRWENAEQV